MSNEFKNRVYGCVVVKSVNANYNADFSGLPRRLKSDGTFYATDKSFKWLVRNYIKKNYTTEKILFTKNYDDNFKDTIDLKKSFENITGIKDLKELKKKEILPLLTDCIDVRLFGAVFSPENSKKNKNDENKNISIHGPVQINHAIDIYQKGRVYSDEILAPFTAIGSMSKATEVHYIHNFSINPKNLSTWRTIFKTKQEDKASKNKKLFSEDEKIKEFKLLSENDLIILKESFNNCVTYYDSHSKAGAENELSIYVTLKENSKLVLLGFAQFIKFYKANEKYKLEDGNKLEEENKLKKINKYKVYYKNTFNLTSLIKYLEKYNEDIETIEIYYSNILTDLIKDENILENDENKIKLYDLEELNKKQEETNSNTEEKEENK